MKKLYFEADTKQNNALHGLAYRIADNAYMRERYDDAETVHERAENHKTILSLFETLDALNVPFWVQNSVICGAEVWRDYKSGALQNKLKAKNIIVNF